MLHPRALHYTATLMIISLRSPSEKLFIFYFWSHACVCASNSPAASCVCAFLCVSEVLVVPQPVSVRILTGWPIIAFGSIPALMRHFLARWLLFSIISSRHAEARSWKQAPGWWISPKNHTPEFSGRALYRKVSVHCTINTERPACEVQRLLLLFWGPSCHPWRTVQCQTMHALKASLQQMKSDSKYTKISHFMGCEMRFSQHLDVIQAEALFINFFVVHNIALFSRSWPLFRCRFLQKQIAEDYVNR